MTPRRGRRRKKMAGRGAGGGATEEQLAPVPEPSASAAATVDSYAQARKALSLRSPFDAEETASRVPTLPNGLAKFFARQDDGRRRHRKALEDSEEKPERASAAPPTVWDQTEEYFRQVTLDDIDGLVPRLPFSSGQLDSCFFIPDVGNGAEAVEKVGSLDAPKLEFTSGLVLDEARQAEAEKNEEPEDAEEAVKLPIEMDEVEKNVNTMPETQEDGSSLFNWLLGTKERFILTSERPNKKRKLLGRDAGLDHLLVLPRPQAEAGSICDLCCYGDSGLVSNRLLCCDSCKVFVHQRCYGVPKMPEGPWLCSWCRHLEGRPSNQDGCDPGPRPCLLCPKARGALKPVAKVASRIVDGGGLKFAHLFCGLWIPEVYVKDIQAMEPVMNIGGIQVTRKKLVCNVCKVKHGACVRCSHGTCRTSFHPICARESKHQMEIWGKFGNDNVEMRAYCSKHSTLGDVFSEAELPNAAPDTRRIPKLKPTRKTRDHRRMAHELTGSSSDQSNKMETNVVQDPLSCVHGSEGQTKEIDMDNAIEWGSLVRNSPDFTVVLKKLIDRGKISVDNLASEMGISSDSLQAALVGETTTFSPGLKSKIIKWLQTFVHMPPVQTKVVDGSKGRKGRGAYNSSGDKRRALDVPDPVLVKSLLPRRKTKASVVGDTQGESNGEPSSPGRQDCTKEEELQQVILDDMSKSKDPGSCLGLLSGDGGNPVERENNVTSTAEDMKGRSSLEHGVDLADAAMHNAPENDHFYGHFDHDIHLLSSYKDIENSSACSSISYIHPFTRKRLMHTRDQCLKHNKDELYFSEADNSADPYLSRQHLHSLCSTVEQKLDASVQDQTSHAKSLGILELSAEDEVEGEMLYLQARLLDNAVALKHSYENLMVKVVQNLPHELDAFIKRKWDLIIVSQFLREAREAKKRRRKELRHKEAQAVLAAAAAAVAASSRNPALRKDANDGIGIANQEIPPKAGCGAGRVGMPPASVPRGKDSAGSSLHKIPSDKHSGIFKLPMCSKEDALHCDICMRTETILNRIFICSGCKVSVHLDCYHSIKYPTGPWKCEYCEEMSQKTPSPTDQTDSMSRSFAPQCGLCGCPSGSFRKTIDGQWVHAFCAEWLLESKFRRGQEYLVEGMDAVLGKKDACCICHRTLGACLKCSYQDCQITFHPFCGRGVGLYMNIKGVSGGLQHKAYCGKHSVEQREADSQQYGAEELKSMKQIRVELEKLRILCERIIKREKIKRDLVQCSHDILASRKDSAAFSFVIRNSLHPPGASSESATTSIDNRSYSGAIQRSDDVTVDSTVSGQHRIRVSLHNRDTDRNTEDSSTSQLSFKRKLTDRSLIAGKQLPHRPSIPLQNQAEDGEKKSVERKHRETFQKEFLMTSDQASMQNQRLPKGYAYVPVGRLSKEKPLNHDTEPHEPQDPGG